MNRIYHFLLAVAATMLAACSSDEAMPEAQDVQMPRELRFKMDVSKPSFDSTTRATGAGWEKGDSLFLRFTKTGGYAYGIAVYDGLTGDWVMKDVPTLDIEETKKLELAFLDGGKKISGQTVTLSPSTAVYTDDGNGTYQLTMANNFVPVIKGHLVPRTSRIRFKGEAGMKVTVNGLKHNTQFNTSTHAVTSATSAVALTVGTNGYTPYVYCTFASSSCSLSVMQDISVGANEYRYTFTATCPSTMLQTGKSGWMNLPTYNSHNGWEMKAEALHVTPAKTSVTMAGSGGSETVSIDANLTWSATSSASWLTCTKKSNSLLELNATENTTSSERTATVSIKDEKGTVKATITVRQKTSIYTVNGVKFKMIAVKGGTFTMGATSEQSNGYTPDSDEKPTHSVTLSDYCIGETEVTQALWYAVMGAKPSSSYSWTSQYGLGDNYPAYYISYTECEEFITKLNSMTGETFRMPTEAEWEYAARGGNKSKAYIFSGSSTIGDVAWYEVNSYDKGSSSSDYGTHQVGTKKANELGIYDMSGNVYEWCSDWYGSYSSNAQTNPTGPATGSYRVSRGGSWDFTAAHCRVAIRNGYSPGYHFNNLGLRLAR